ncbi:MAG: SEC-C metal-binding domain-containing protein [Anaerolineae bacterium]|jgi:preprotein translocase subunit SecA|nr:SEC-C metal-binding domain-containing protein [Anaerolineae bacterium]
MPLKFLERVFGNSNDREIARLQKTVQTINALEPEYQALSDAQLRAKTDEFRQRHSDGESLDEILPEAFAAVREAGRRTIGHRHYDVQLIGGMILHHGKVAEMRTGEGKTLVATLPLYLNALTGLGAHLVTVNDYLARRDGGWMGRIYHALGMQVGLVIPDFAAIYNPEYIAPEGLLEDDRLVHWEPMPRAKVYAADIVYATGNELGFDYLRDNMVGDLDHGTQRGLHYAIIDEIDSILIDEARTPLIISGPADEPSDLYRQFADLVHKLHGRPVKDKDDDTETEIDADADYEIDIRTQVVILTENGISKVERWMNIPEGESLYEEKHADIVPYLDNALRAKEFFKKDKEYVIQGGEVIIIDQQTGRMMFGRRYSEGLHQAIEAKENVEVRRETLTYATITIQNFFRMYQKKAGMTGTAETEKEEFRKTYDLDVIVLPTNVQYQARFGDLIRQEIAIAETDITFFANDNDHSSLKVVVFDAEDGTRYYQRLDMFDQIYRTESAKFDAVISEITAMNKLGRPVLIGTTGIETSERLSRRLKAAKIDHAVLNAKKHEQEASIIAQAGRLKAVTIATNMAGRGVDILLGGDPGNLAAREIQKLLKIRLLETEESGTVLPPISQEFAQEFEAYQASKNQNQRAMAAFFAEQLIKEGMASRAHLPKVKRLVMHALGEHWTAASKLVQQSPKELNPNILWRLEEIKKRFEETEGSQDFAAERLFSSYHNEVMAVVRSVMQGDEESAKAILDRHPVLPQEIIEKIKEVKVRCDQERQAIKALGGLHVIGTERHEARRIDNQLRGRAGRQGDPGSSRFYISLEDELMRRFGGERLRPWMERAGIDEMPLEFNVISKLIASVQEHVEGYNFDMRKHVLEYDNVVSRQREVVYAERQKILSLEDHQAIMKILESEMTDVVSRHTQGAPETWDSTALAAELRKFLHMLSKTDAEEFCNLKPNQIIEQCMSLAKQTRQEHIRKTGERVFTRLNNTKLSSLMDSAAPLDEEVMERLLTRLEESDLEPLRDFTLSQLPAEMATTITTAIAETAILRQDREIMLALLDNRWRHHLTNLEELREGIGLRAIGQQNPLIAFQREAFDMYQDMLAKVQTDIAHNVFIHVADEASSDTRAVSRQRGRTPLRSTRIAKQSARASQQQTRLPTKASQRPGTQDLGRNDPCWCGSGKKYKHCHMREDEQTDSQN